MQPALKKSLTLIELMIAVSLLSVLVLAFSGLELFSRRQVVTVDRQVVMQNEASLAFDHMSKYVQQGVGNPGNTARQALRGISEGFSVFIEPTPATPINPLDDLRLDYFLTGNTLTCRVTDPDTGVVISNEILATHILSGVVSGLMPANPTNGFYINITDDGSMVEIGLVARWLPANPVGIDNPQAVLNGRFYTRSSAAR